MRAILIGCLRGLGESNSILINGEKEHYNARIYQWAVY